MAWSYHSKHTPVVVIQNEDTSIRGNSKGDQNPNISVETAATRLFYLIANESETFFVMITKLHPWLSIPWASLKMRRKGNREFAIILRASSTPRAFANLGFEVSLPLHQKFDNWFLPSRANPGKVVWTMASTLLVIHWMARIPSSFSKRNRLASRACGGVWGQLDCTMGNILWWTKFCHM